MEDLLSFIPGDNLLVKIAIVILALVLVVSVLKGLIRLALVLAVVGVVLFFLFGFSSIEKPAHQTAHELEFLQAFEEKDLDVEVLHNADGTYVVRAESATILGDVASESVIVETTDKTYKIGYWMLDERLRALTKH